MSALQVLIGLGYVTLVTGVGIALWSGLRDMPRLSRVADVAAWTAAIILVLGVLLAWGSELPALDWLVAFIGEPEIEGPGLSLVLMAALAIPVGGRRRKPHWGRALLYVPALLLAAAAMTWLLGPNGGTANSESITPLRFSLAVCAGLGARTWGQALQEMAAGTQKATWSGRLPYSLLTLVVGCAALVSLWQRGMVWTGVDPVVRGGIAAAWLAWTADWLARNADPRLRGALTTVAVLLLILVAARGG